MMRSFGYNVFGVLRGSTCEEFFAHDTPFSGRVTFALLSIMRMVHKLMLSAPGTCDVQWRANTLCTQRCLATQRELGSPNSDWGAFEGRVLAAVVAGQATITHA